MDAMRPTRRRVLLLLAGLGSACVALAAPGRAAETDAATEADPKTEVPDAHATFVRSQWHSLFLDGEKIGYTSRSLYRLSDGGHRLKYHTFLRPRPDEKRFGFYRKTTADVDARFRPRALTCEVQSGRHGWRTTGRTRAGVLHLERTVDGRTASADVPVEDGMTLRCWAVPATVMSRTPTGRTRRWLAVDASLGALLPEPVLVHVLGPRTLPGASEGDGDLHGTAVVSVCGVEQVAHLVGEDGRVLRRIWQSSPMVAESAPLSQARRLDTQEEAPPGAALAGFSPRGYRSDRFGLSLNVPPVPYALHAFEKTGAVRIVDLTDEARVEIRPVLGGEPPPVAAAASGKVEGDGPAEAPPRLAAHPVQKAWAARFDKVTVEPSPAAVPAGADVLAATGIARLGCTTFHYRNLLLWGAGLTWFVTIRVADRPVGAKPMLAENVPRSLRIRPPQGRLPLQAIGSIVRSPLYGFQVRLPSDRWTVPRHTGGLPAALELARADQAAAVFRMMDRDPADEPLQAFVGRQAEAAARRLGVSEPDAQPAMLGGLPAYEIEYEGDGLLAGRPASSTAVYVRRQGRVLALVLLVADDAPKAVRDEAKALRQGVQFLH